MEVGEERRTRRRCWGDGKEEEEEEEFRFLHTREAMTRSKSLNQPADKTHAHT
jgi:hypothetical protein